MQKWFGLAQDTSGNIIPSPTINVYAAGTLNLATIYSDNSYSSLANPFTGASDGSYEFYAENGRYDVVPSKSGFTFDASNSSDVILQDNKTLIVQTPVTVGNTTAETDVFTMTVKGGYLGTNKGFHVRLGGQISAPAVASIYTLRLYYGGAELSPLGSTDYQLATSGNAFTGAGLFIEAWFRANNSASAQLGHMWHTMEQPASGSNTSVRAYSAAVNSATDQTFKITFDWGVASVDRTVTFTDAIVTALP